MDILRRRVAATPRPRRGYFVATGARLRYGTKGWDTYAQQGGAYQRDFVGVRVERCSEGTIDAMHAYFEALQLRSRIPRGGAREARGVVVR